MKGFRTYQLAKQLFQSIKAIQWPTGEFKDQAHRASLSIVLNISEGYGKRTQADRRRYYHNAMGSLREVQACLDLIEDSQAGKMADNLGAHLYRLIQNPGQFT